MRRFLPALLILAALYGCSSEQEFKPGMGKPGPPPPAGVMNTPGGAAKGGPGAGPAPQGK